MKTILVTGGTGLVGKAIEAIILEQKPIDEIWHFSCSKETDLTDVVATQELFGKVKPTHVIHLAAVVGGLFHNMNNNLDFLRKNMHINDNVLQMAFTNNCVKVVSCMSTCVFPDQTTYPINETMLHLGPPHPSNYGYSYAKRLIDIQNRAYYEKYGCCYTSVIPCNIFGPHDNYNLQTSHVIPGMIHRMHKLMQTSHLQKEEQVFPVYGSGKPLRQFIYSQDLAQLIIWVMRDYNFIEPLILSVDEHQELSILAVAQAIAKAFDFKGKIVCDTSKSDGQYKKTTSNNKLRMFLPNFEFTNFDVAIKNSVEWFKENYEISRK